MIYKEEPPVSKEDKEKIDNLVSVYLANILSYEECQTELKQVKAFPVSENKALKLHELYEDIATLLENLDYCRALFITSSYTIIYP